MEAQDQQPKRPQRPAGEGGGAVPPDFAYRIATKVVFISERERDPDVAAAKLAEFLIRNVARSDRVKYFADAMEILENDPETTRCAGMALTSLVLDRQDIPKYEKFLSDMLDQMISDHVREAKPPFQLEYRRKSYSAFARILGECFIAMMGMNSELYEVISHVFSLVIRKEMDLEVDKKEAKSEGRRIRLSGDEGADPSKFGKKFFDDLVDYIHARGEQRSGTLQQQNPNEFVSVLADRMRGTRRYVIQDILNRQAMERRKEAVKELDERLASAEEIILARDAFRKGISLYWLEKQYNFKFLAVEKVRVTVQVLAVLVGILNFLAGYLGAGGMTWWEGLTVTAVMYLFARVFGARAYFRRFFPEDVSKELEVVIGSFTPTLRKMSKEQFDTFSYHQIRDRAVKSHLAIIPEFVRYVFAVMPERKNVIVQREELSDILQNMEMDIARILRTGGRSNLPRKPVPFV